MLPPAWSEPTRRGFEAEGVNRFAFDIESPSLALLEDHFAENRPQGGDVGLDVPAATRGCLISVDSDSEDVGGYRSSVMGDQHRYHRSLFGSSDVQQFGPVSDRHRPQDVEFHGGFKAAPTA